MVTVKCVECGEQHELFWLVQSPKQPPEPHYRCNHIAKVIEATKEIPYNTIRYHTGRIPYPQENLTEDQKNQMRTEWSRGYAEFRRKGKQLQLPMLYQR